MKPGQEHRHMTTQNLKFDQADKQDDKEKTVGDAPLSTETGLRKLSSRRLWPVYAASAATLFWTVGIAWAAYKTGFFASGSNLPMPDLAALIAGLAAPISVFWLMALVAQRTDPLLERRLEIARGMKKALAPIEAAEKKLATIRKNLDGQVKNIELATDVATQRLDNLEGRFNEQLSGLFSATTDADAKAVSIKDTLQRERLAMEDLSSNLADKIAGIEKSIADLKSGLGEAAGSARQQSESAAKLMNRHSQAIQQNAADTVVALTTVGQTLDQHRQNLEDSTTTSKEGVESAFATVLDKMDELSIRMDGLETSAGKLTGKLGEQAQDLNLLAGKAAEDAKVFENILEQRASGLGAVAEGAESASTKALERLEALRAQLEKQSDTMGDATTRNAGELEQVVKTMVDQAELIGTVAGDAVRNIREAESSMDERGAGVGQLLEDTKQRLEAVEEQIMKQREALAQATQLSAETLEGSSLAFQVRSREIGEAASEAAAALDVGSDALSQHLDSLKTMGAEARDELGRVAIHLKDEGDRTIGKIRLTTDMLGNAATSFGEEREKFLQDADETVAKLASGSEKLRAGTEKLDDVSASAAERLTSLFGEMQNISDQTEYRMEGAVDRMHTRASTELGELHTRFAKTLDEAMQEINSKVDEAGKQATKAARKVGDETERLAGRAEMFVTRADQLEDKYSKNMQEDFVRTASLLIDSLSSGAFDLSKALETEIPDNVWRKYLDGDTSIFARRSVKIGSSKTRKMVAKRYEEDAEFRDHVTKYIRDFEHLMERVDSLSGANAVSITMISSELGKLYVMLAQAMKKF